MAKKPCVICSHAEALLFRTMRRPRKSEHICLLMKYIVPLRLAATFLNTITFAADEIMKFKQLFDAGVITQEEFEAKKKQLLGI